MVGAISVNMGAIAVLRRSGSQRIKYECECAELLFSEYCNNNYVKNVLLASVFTIFNLKVVTCSLSKYFRVISALRKLL